MELCKSSLYLRISLPLSISRFRLQKLHIHSTTSSRLLLPVSAASLLFLFCQDMAFTLSFTSHPLPLLLFLLLASPVPRIRASDEDALQDFCVADTSSSIHVNGFLCTDPSLVTADDFSSSFISNPGNTSNSLGVAVTVANAAKFPGLNTFGISYARIDLAPGGLNPPHVHPRASELLYLEKGTLYVGFVTTENKLFSKTITTGELFIFPKGLIHFQLNIGGDESAVVISALTSQNPGTSQVAKALFAATPEIDDAVLEKAFHVGNGEIKHLKTVLSKS